MWTSTRENQLFQWRSRSPVHEFQRSHPFHVAKNAIAGNRHAPSAVHPSQSSALAVDSQPACRPARAQSAPRSWPVQKAGVRTKGKTYPERLHLGPEYLEQEGPGNRQSPAASACASSFKCSCRTYCHRTWCMLNKCLRVAGLPRLALARIERIADDLSPGEKIGPSGCLDLFAIDILRTGDAKDALRRRRLAATAIVGVRCRSRPRRAAARAGPASDLALAASRPKPGRATTKDARMHAITPRTPAGTRTWLTSEATSHISSAFEVGEEWGSQARIFGPGFPQRHQVWSVGEISVVASPVWPRPSHTSFPLNSCEAYYPRSSL